MGVDQGKGRDILEECRICTTSPYVFMLLKHTWKYTDQILSTIAYLIIDLITL
jgi:hypothetical protein